MSAETKKTAVWATHSGIYADALQEIKKEGCQIKLISVPRARLEAMFETGAADLLFPSNKTTHRDELGVFIPMIKNRATLISVTSSPLSINSLEPHTAAFFCAFCITFPIGFLLSKYIVWTTSIVKSHVQLFRYFVIVIMNLFFNLFFIKLLVEYFHFYPTIAKIITTTISVLFSYLSHKHFTFKVDKE